MKRNYIIPTTESIAFHAGSICDASAGAGTMTITGPVGGGSEYSGIDPADPM